MSAVFDASVVVKWFVDDPLSKAALHAKSSIWPAVAPDLARVEVANALRRYVVHRELESSVARDSVVALDDALKFHDHAPLMSEAFALACRSNHSMSDCLYVVLARRLAIPLITADRKLVEKFAGETGVVVHLLSKDSPAFN